MNILIFEIVNDFLDEISKDDAARILAHLKSLQENRTEGLTMKSLKGKIKEILVGPYRIVFFGVGGTEYVVDAFRKKSKKTPKRIINQAEKIYKEIHKNYLNNYYIKRKKDEKNAKKI